MSNKVAILLWLYHTDLAEEFKDILLPHRDNIAIFLGLCKDNYNTQAESIFKDNFKDLDISYFDNSGTDILPTLNFEAAVLTGAQRVFSGISVFTLIAIPFFILAGNIMNRGGIAVRLINFAKVLTGRVPGALAHTNAVANMMFGAISGSGVAAASAMGSIIGPIQEEEGYDSVVRWST